MRVTLEEAKERYEQSLGHDVTEKLTVTLHISTTFLQFAIKMLVCLITSYDPKRKQRTTFNMICN